MNPRSWRVLPPLTLALMTACSVAPLASSTGPSPTASTTLSTTPSASPSGCPDAPAGSNNLCLGPLAAGTYTTRVFEPALTYTVPGGWTNIEDLPGQVLFLPPGATHAGVDRGTSDYLGVYASIAAPLKDCSGHLDPTVAPGVAGYLSWLTGHPSLDVSDPKPITVAGLIGSVVDIGLRADATKVCSDPQQGIDRFAEVAIGLSPSDFSASAIPSLSLRVELFDVNQRILAILVSDTRAGGSDEADWNAAAQGVIDTFSFALP
jgi:hypothetical protein